MANYYPNQAYQNQNQGGVLGWDDEIQNENSFEILPEGDYTFRITNFTKAHHEGSAKIPPCPKAIVEFEISDNHGNTVTIAENFLLHSKLEWKLSQFFIAVGMKKKGEPLRMRWTPELIGKTGTCKVIIHKYVGNDQQEHQKNQIDKFYEPPLTSQPASFKPYQPNWKG
ncbi:MAG: DUF669 domain-containing protein [Ruminococcus sp.]|nr:DUF669 domain-containing protein [Ruminococcus sp.]